MPYTYYVWLALGFTLMFTQLNIIGCTTEVLVNILLVYMDTMHGSDAREGIPSWQQGTKSTSLVSVDDL